MATSQELMRRDQEMPDCIQLPSSHATASVATMLSVLSEVVIGSQTSRIGCAASGGGMAHLMS